MVFGATEIALRGTDLYTKDGRTGEAEGQLLLGSLDRGALHFCRTLRSGGIIGYSLLFEARYLSALH